MLPRVKIDIQTQQGIERDLYKFAIEGLRTLLFSKKELSQKEIEEFMQNYTNVKTSVDPQKEKKLLAMYD